MYEFHLMSLFRHHVLRGDNSGFCLHLFFPTVTYNSNSQIMRISAVVLLLNMILSPVSTVKLKENSFIMSRPKSNSSLKCSREKSYFLCLTLRVFDSGQSWPNCLLCEDLEFRHRPEIN